MSQDALLVALGPWMRVSTWHTAHPLDEQRFHRAVASACKRVGTPLDAAEIEKAIMHLAEKYHGPFKGERLFRMMDEYAQEAETISLYVHNTRDDT
jgi:hypothetical protein